MKLSKIYIPEVLCNGRVVSKDEVPSFLTLEEALREAKIMAYDLYQADPPRMMYDGRGDELHLNVYAAKVRTVNIGSNLGEN